jgi:hypothetical protein
MKKIIFKKIKIYQLMEDNINFLLKNNKQKKMRRARYIVKQKNK